MTRFVGHHGTSRRNANLIKKNGFKSSNADNWLGPGIYFFEDDVKIAYMWASRRHKGEKVTVLHVDIIADDSKILDVSIPKSPGHKKFFDFKEDFQLALEKSKSIIKEDSARSFDAKIFNLLCDREGFILIRHFTYTYDKFDKAYNVYSRVPNGIELCVRDPSCVSNLVEC